MVSQISVVIGDDHRLYREALSQIFRQEESIQIVGQAANRPETIDVVSKLKPDVVLLNIHMPEMDSVEIIHPIIAKSLKTKILILNHDMDEDMVFQFLKAGAKGYISKDASITDLTKAIHTVHQGELWLERKLIARFFDEEAVVAATVEDRPGRSEEGLTPREQEILRCLTTGCTNKEIAESLFISEKTVKCHLNSIFRKLNVTRRLEAILYAIKRGLS
jgi:DNA-binding NarL/FixJ family response regulator